MDHDEIKEALDNLLMDFMHDNGLTKLQFHFEGSWGGVGWGTDLDLHDVQGKPPEKT